MNREIVNRRVLDPTTNSGYTLTTLCDQGAGCHALTCSVAAPIELSKSQVVPY